MENQTGDAGNILLGVVIGGIIGTGAVYLLHVCSDAKKSHMRKIGDRISEYGELLEKSIVDNRKEAIEEIEKCIPGKSASLNGALELIATGINLWKKIKKGA